MRREQIVCDECGSVRRDVNHWLVVTECSDPIGIHIYEWPTNSMVAGAIHLCGQDCVHRRVSSFLGRPKEE